ncbi:hypothetical protein IDJ75_01575 [Mucilaginibacter rigui]|uniref:Uncharacterized protein n=1 Tax=Mucilaginibacter rigui TaxID=534635 RepID=A0ABR7X036_9SPHI|nr:hypothetical protein [Mucilaginibacter rigui]MBD1383952.1 hypothetical protein [Mucilaginibacter rigui]
MKLLKLLLLAGVLSPAFGYAQKAYEAVKYTGKVQNMAVRFILANGYLGASEVKLTDGKTHKTASFMPEYGYADDNKNLTFYRQNDATKTAYFAISGMEELFETPPVKIKGIYYIKEKAYRFVLKR